MASPGILLPPLQLGVELLDEGLNRCCHVNWVESVV
jgi:hypothetical protein